VARSDPALLVSAGAKPALLTSACSIMFVRSSRAPVGSLYRQVTFLAG
jgi:hypothetical protein